MRTANIVHLGIKELYSLIRDPILLLLIVYSFTVGVYSAAIAMPDSLNRAPIAIVDEDGFAAVGAYRQRLLSASFPSRR